jgi:large subunit ribosomal protein L6
MSRLGKVPVLVPSGVKVTSEKEAFSVSGPKGSLRFPLHHDLGLDIAGDRVRVQRRAETREARAHHGLTRAMLANMVRGVTEGYEKRLEIVGVGWGAKIEGASIVLTVGFCHPAKIPIPKGVTAECPSANLVVIKGSDKQSVGELAATIRRVRPPEPYNGKGVKYSDEVIKRKQGKSFGTT